MWKVAASTLMLVFAVATSGCSGVNNVIKKQNAQDSVTAADVTACHYFAQSVFHVTSPITQATADHMLADLRVASSSTLKEEGATLQSQIGSNNNAAIKTSLEDIASTCNGLGLIDANGNPT